MVRFVILGLVAVILGYLVFANSGFGQGRMTGNFDYSLSKAVWDNNEVPYPKELLVSKVLGMVSILGDSNVSKWIDVDLSAQRLYAHEGDRIVFDFPISSGLPWTPTQTGEFRIWAKVLAQRMTGGTVENGSYYDLPNVPFVQYYSGEYSIHGAYWHNDFGKPRSHGCVNMRIDDAKTLYFWTNPLLPQGTNFLANIKPEESTKIVIRGTTPTENIY